MKMFWFNLLLTILSSSKIQGNYFHSFKTFLQRYFQDHVIQIVSRQFTFQCEYKTNFKLSALPPFDVKDGRRSTKTLQFKSLKNIERNHCIDAIKRHLIDFR